MELAQDAGQFSAGDVEQRGVGEDAVEVAGGQFEPEKILMPDFAAGIGARHVGEGFGAVEADGAAPAVLARPGVDTAPRSST